VKAILAGLGILLDVRAMFQLTCRCPSDIEVNQASKRVISSLDALVDLLGSIEQLVNRLAMYTRITLTPPIVEIVVKIMARTTLNSRSCD
jgi:hypothetical protein